MKSLIEGFGDIASRLAQIEQARMAEIATTTLPETVDADMDWTNVYVSPPAGLNG